MAARSVLARGGEGDKGGEDGIQVEPDEDGVICPGTEAGNQLVSPPRQAAGLVLAARREEELG